MEGILSTILNYWLTFLLTAVGAGITIFIKKTWNLYREDRKKEFDEIILNFDGKHKALLKEVDRAMLAGRDESKEDDAVLQQQINTVDNKMESLRAGVLSMQKKEFKENCRKLLEEDHVITLDEWEEINSDHEAYNGLGGNHNGDFLFELVKKKAEETLTKIE